jgi:hypothetical protein
MKKVIERAKKKTQQKLLERQIDLAARQVETAGFQAKAAELQVQALKESWWKKNILPLLSLLLTVFQVMGFGGSAPRPDPRPPAAVVVVVKESDARSQAEWEQDRRPTEPFDPEPYSLKVPSFYASPIDFPPIPSHADQHTKDLLLSIQNSIESSSNPEAARLTIIANLETSKQQRLIDEKFVDTLIHYVQKVRVIRPNSERVSVTRTPPAATI